MLACGKYLGAKMKTLFICLSNSKKFGERCIAGIEVKKTIKAYQPIEKEGKPKWLRPISKYQHGAVGEDLVGGIKLMDIIEIDVEEFCPSGYQSENATFKPASVKKVGNIRLSDKDLDRLIDMEQYKDKIYSIGYATHTIESFINTLKKFNITAIADVRSQPYSKFKPEFNRENLKQALISAHPEMGDF